VITSSATAGGSPYTAGTWTNKAVTVTFGCTPLSTLNQVQTLTAPQQVAGPTTNSTVTGTCSDAVGNSAVTTFGTTSSGIDIDLTNPVASASATTTDNASNVVPYAAGTWTNHDVVVTFACTDTGTNQSGLATTAAPITVSAQGTTGGVIGGCTDNAGNNANPAAFFGPILIDKTPPVCTVVLTPARLRVAARKLLPVSATVTVTDPASGAHGFVLDSVTSNHPATAAADVAGFTPGTASATGQLRGVRGRIYTFTFHGFDAAGNASTPCVAQAVVGR